jgi:hypothetical protein
MRDDNKELYEVLVEAPELDDRDLLMILTYFDELPMPFESTVMHDTLQRLIPDRKERIMGWLTQPYYDKGKAEGKAEAKAEGKAQALL